MYVIYRFVYIYKFIFYRFTIYLYKITYIFVKFGNFWVAILNKIRQFLRCNSEKMAIFEFLIPAKVGNFELQFEQKSGIFFFFRFF